MSPWDTLFKLFLLFSIPANQCEQIALKTVSYPRSLIILSVRWCMLSCSDSVPLSRLFICYKASPIPLDVEKVVTHSWIRSKAWTIYQGSTTNDVCCPNGAYYHSIEPSCSFKVLFFVGQAGSIIGSLFNYISEPRCSLCWTCWQGCFSDESHCGK